jgi:hypothetical protein
MMLCSEALKFPDASLQRFALKTEQPSPAHNHQRDGTLCVSVREAAADVSKYMYVSYVFFALKQEEPSSCLKYL